LIDIDFDIDINIITRKTTLNQSMSVIVANQPYSSDGFNAVILNITYDKLRDEPDFKTIKKLAKKFNLTTFYDGVEHSCRVTNEHLAAAKNKLNQGGPQNTVSKMMTGPGCKILSTRCYYYHVSEKIFNYAKVKVCISQPKGCEWAFLTNDGNYEFNKKIFDRDETK